MSKLFLFSMLLIAGACSKSNARNRAPANPNPTVVELVPPPAVEQPEPASPPPTTVPPPSEQGSLVEVISPCSGEEVLLRVGPDVLRVVPATKGKGAYMIRLEPEVLYTSQANDCEFYIEVDGTLRDGE